MNPVGKTPLKAGPHEKKNNCGMYFGPSLTSIYPNF